MLAINNRNLTLGISPFFLTHGYHVEPVQQVETSRKASVKQRAAEDFVQRLHEAEEFAQAAMASAQQKIEDYANQSRAASVTLKKDDLVWLNLRNIETPQPSKKLSWINSKYRVTKVISPYVVELDVPTGIFPRFHVDLLKRAAEDPLPSQITDDVQPPSLVPQSEDQDEEFQVERILKAKKKRVEKGSKREVFVK